MILEGHQQALLVVLDMKEWVDLYHTPTSSLVLVSLIFTQNIKQ